MIIYRWQSTMLKQSMNLCVELVETAYIANWWQFAIENPVYNGF